MVEKLEVLKCTWKVLENQSTFVMYLSTSTSTQDFSEMYLKGQCRPVSYYVCC